jgi:hypothetical protein
VKAFVASGILNFAWVENRTGLDEMAREILAVAGNRMPVVQPVVQ